MVQLGLIWRRLAHVSVMSCKTKANGGMEKEVERKKVHALSLDHDDGHGGGVQDQMCPPPAHPRPHPSMVYWYKTTRVGLLCHASHWNGKEG